MEFGKGGLQYPITIPAGTHCTVADHGQYFVDDLSFLPANSIQKHDATYYGIRLNAEQVEA